MTTTTKQVSKKVVEFYNEIEIAVLREFEARIKGKDSFKQAILKLMRQKV